MLPATRNHDASRHWDLGLTWKLDYSTVLNAKSSYWDLGLTWKLDYSTVRNAKSSFLLAFTRVFKNYLLDTWPEGLAVGCCRAYDEEHAFDDFMRSIQIRGLRTNDERGQMKSCVAGRPGNVSKIGHGSRSFQMARLPVLPARSFRFRWNLKSIASSSKSTLHKNFAQCSNTSRSARKVENWKSRFRTPFGIFSFLL